MAGLVAPSSGSVSIGGRRLDRLLPVELQRMRARNIGVVFQAFNLIDALTALENVALVLRFAGTARRDSILAAETILDRVGIGHLGSQPASRLSQGEKQRVAIARAVANDPFLLLADEPTASLDSEHGLEIIEILRRYARESQAAVVVSTHDPRLTAFAYQIVRISDGKVGKKD
jgi:putative ABC transport system ATP-binding protein